MLTALQRLRRGFVSGGTLDCCEDRRFGVWADLWGRHGKIKKGVTSDTFFKESASCEKLTSCIKAVMLTALQRLAPRLRRRRNFGLRRGSPLWGVGGPVRKTWENKKGRELGHFLKESAACEKPTSCVKAVMLTALQRLAPRLRRRRIFGLRRGSPLWGVGGPVAKTWENKKGRELGHFFKAPASSEKPTSCLKAVMLTALQRLASRLRRRRNFGLRRGSPLWGVGGPVGKT